MTKGTGSPLKAVRFSASAYSMPTTTPPRYSPSITSVPFFGKNAAVNSA